MSTSWLETKPDGQVELSFQGIRLSQPRPEIVNLATLGFGFLENKILQGKSRYPCQTPALKQEIEQGLLSSSRSETGFKDPGTGKLDALAATLTQACRDSDTGGIVLLHAMRRICTSTFNYDEFLGDDRDSSYRQRNLGQRLGAEGIEYHYFALTRAAPPVPLLDNSQTWDQFKQGYRTHLTLSVLAEATAWILGAVAKQLLPVLLCCEPFVGCFDQLSDGEKNAYGCHRFLLAGAVTKSIPERGIMIQCTHLNPSQIRTSCGSTEEPS
jgi:hypothetical protein